MPGIIPSKNSAFRLVKPLPEPEMEKPIVQPPTNPHGYKWRIYTESHMRRSLCSDVQKRNLLLSGVRRFEDELKSMKRIKSVPEYKHYMFLKEQRDVLKKHLTTVEQKMDVHVDYVLYHKFKH
jgi:hypothetical protein